MSESNIHPYIGARLSAMMFLQFFVWGAWFVTVGNYMFKAGMGDAIGWAYSVGPVAAILSPFLLGMVADRFFATERVLGTLHILGGVLLFGAAAQPSAFPFIGLLFLHTLCYMPTLGLTNTLVFHNITNQEKQFPLIRVFGTLGWIAAGTLVSMVLHADETVLPLQIAGGAGVLLGLYCLTLPHTPPPAKGKKVSVRDLLCLDALSLLKKPSFLVFIVSSMLICIPLAAYYAYAPVFVNASGLADPAFKMSFGQMSEIFFMLVMPLFFAKLGVKKMLLIGMAAWVARYGLFALGAPEGTLWMILIAIALHGVCYDFFFVTGQIYVDKEAPLAVRGQAQGLLILVTQGIGMLVGAQVSAKLFSAFVQGREADVLLGWQQYWEVPCIGAALILVFFALLFRERRKGE
ncbi:nucleoside permease [Pontiella sulfatireligans]|uniref:Nucleoside transporter YegT n=1 Tax=Pontiella sulfatireligans TaxID=2750658 RepID=A0A6C2UJT2_9BACT|nr:nucleoside permease [Pontiella sulfatireligans]VGO20492.1 Putative nucleoside transporter YegT [Pontiella sulfatireligans]